MHAHHADHPSTSTIDLQHNLYTMKNLQGGTGRIFADCFCEHHRDLKKYDKDAAKPDSETTLPTKWQSVVFLYTGETQKVAVS